EPTGDTHEVLHRARLGELLLARGERVVLVRRPVTDPEAREALLETSAVVAREHQEREDEDHRREGHDNADRDRHDAAAEDEGRHRRPAIRRANSTSANSDDSSEMP